MNRKALIIGNKNYSDKPLETPIDDSKDVALLLSRKNFRISLKNNLNIESMNKVIIDFVDSIKEGKNIAIFYFAGHGVQIDGNNYLLPIGESFSDEINVKYRAYPLSELIERLEQNKNNINIIILYACRDNPFKKHRSNKGGLAETLVSKGTFIAFATSPGQTASDYSKNGRNGLYTSHLLNALNIPSLNLDERFKIIRENVYKESKERQLPWVSNSIIGDFNFDTKQDKIVGFPMAFREASTFELSKDSDINKNYINTVKTWNELVSVLTILCEEGHENRPFCIEMLNKNNEIIPLICIGGGGKIDYGYNLVTIEEYLQNYVDYGCFTNSHILDIAKKAPTNSALYYSINFSERIDALELLSWPTVLWDIYSVDNESQGILQACLINMIETPHLKYPTLEELLESIKSISEIHMEAYVKIEIDNIYENEDYEKYVKNTDEYILTGYCFHRKQFIGFDCRYNELPAKNEWLTYRKLAIILNSVPSFQKKEKTRLSLLMGNDWDDELFFEEHTFLLGYLNSRLIIPE